VLVSGDLVEHAADAEYHAVRELLAPLDAPIHVVAGNHDDRAALRRHFDLPGADDEPVQYVAELGPWRLVVLDSTQPGEDPGILDEQRLSWLDTELTAAPDVPTVLAMHHPPLVTGLPALDAIGLPAEDRAALAAVVERHPQVRRLVAGHMHRAITSVLAGRVVVAVPSTYMQARLDFLAQELKTVPQPAGFAVHALMEGEIVSHVQQVDGG
jgi:Icc protein